MISLLLWTMLASAPAEPGSTYRIRVDCTVSVEVGAIFTGELDITALQCGNHEGFFVPTRRYLQLREADLTVPFLNEELTVRQLQVEAYRELQVAQTQTSSAAIQEAESWKGAYEAEKRGHEATRQLTDRPFFDHPVVWVGIGILGTLGSLWVSSKFLNYGTQ